MWRNIVEIYRYRALIQALVSRELKARYRGSVLGFFWSLLNPLLLMLVYWLVFSIYMRFGMNNYHVFLFCGLLPWIWFSSSMLEGGNSIMSGASLVKKVLFPAEVLPIVVIISNFVHFLLALPILLFFVFVSGIGLSWNICAFPVVILVQALFTLGLVLLMAALSVHYRDIQQIMNNVLTLWFFLSPIIYPVHGLPAAANKVMFLMKLNPMFHIMVGYHHVFLQKMNVGQEVTTGQVTTLYPFDQGLPWMGLLGVSVFSIFLLFFAYKVFNRLKVSFSEEI